MSEHAQTAIDQLRIADNIDPYTYSDPDRTIAYHQNAALVHAILDVGAAIREVGMAGLSGWSALDALAHAEQLGSRGLLP